MAILECELYESTVLELSDFWIEVPTREAGVKDARSWFTLTVILRRERGQSTEL